MCAENSINSVPTTPYNFVKLNNRVVQPPLAEKMTNTGINNIEEAYRDYVTADNRYTGYFDIEVENKTALYIDSLDTEKKHSFFANKDRICIPGSSLRGCMKNIFKIITCSNFKENEDFENRNIYYRSFGEAKSDRAAELYKNIMLKGGKTKAKLGFLLKSKFKDQYYICPLNTKFADCRKEYYGINNKIDWDNDNVKVHTGEMQDKAHCYEFTAPDWNIVIPVDDTVIDNYANDVMRDKDALNILDPQNSGPKGLSLLKGTEDYSHVVPCFYLINQDKVSSIGAGPYYRLMYKDKVAEKLPKTLVDKKVDFSDAVFGNKDYWSSRVYFEDLYLDSQVKPIFEVARQRKFLSSPNPTSFQFYLEPGEDKAKALCWNDETNLRGYKLYWHRNEDWSIDPSDISDKQRSKFDTLEQNFPLIAPLKASNSSHKHIFKGRICFENLDEIELGSLCSLFTLAHKQGICFKLGMGKALGLGSIKITGNLILQKENYYNCLFDEKGFAACAEVADIDIFTKKFAEYMKSKMSEDGNGYKLYKERMKELEYIMDIRYKDEDGASWNEATANMDIEDEAVEEIVAQRIPLPHIEEVVNSFKGRNK